MVESPMDSYGLYKNDMNFDIDHGIDLRFYENGHVAVVGSSVSNVEIIAVVERRKKYSLVYVTVDEATEAFEIDTHELADFLELNLRYRLDHDENPQNLRAFVQAIPDILANRSVVAQFGIDAA